MIADDYLAGALDGGVPLDEVCTQVANENIALAAELQALKAQMAGQSQVEVMQFLYQHPASGERHTVVITRERVENDMCDALFEGLTGCVCQCESVGETNVVECRCDEYAEEFVMVAAPPAAQDVSGLVEALEWCENWFSKHCPTSKVDGFLPIVHPMLKSIRNALAAHRQAQQQGAGHPTYKTKPGDSVMGIALRQLKDESRWFEIRDLNAQAFPDIGPHDYYPVDTLLKLPAA